MYSTVFYGQPRTVNSKRTGPYRTALRAAFSAKYAAFEPLRSDLYGVVYYVPEVPTGADGDNTSKPVWDSLKSLAYRDHFQVRLRIAAVLDLGSSLAVTDLDITSVPDGSVEALVAGILGQKHLIYVPLCQHTSRSIGSPRNEGLRRSVSHLVGRWFPVSVVDAVLAADPARTTPDAGGRRGHSRLRAGERVTSDSSSFRGTRERFQ